MATSERTTSDAFARLDDIFSGTNFGTSSSSSSCDSTNWGGSDSQSIAEAKAISANTSDKAYRRLTSHENVTSYSLLTMLHECPRKYELEKLQANHPSKQVDTGIVNLDFAYGHAVGAGIQTYAATGSLVASILAAMLAWKAPWDAEKENKQGKPVGKSLTLATLAVEKFAYWWSENMSEWEVVVLPSKGCTTCCGTGAIVEISRGIDPYDREEEYPEGCPCCNGTGKLPGKKAVELAFAVDFQNGRYHFGHIDVLLRNKDSGKLAVWEGKTTGFENVDEAMYGNSNQALGYSVVVDAIAKEIGSDGTEYEVLYIVYSSKSREFQLLPFGKSRSQRAEWLQDTLLDHASLETYKRIGFYPKRGESCISRYGFRCNWYGNCTMRNSSLFPGVELKTLEDVNVTSIESLDFVFKLDDLVASQKHQQGENHE